MALNAFELLNGVPEFDGKAEELEIFTRHVEEIRKHVDATFLPLFDLRIRNKIVRRANITLINNNNPHRWEEIKVILRINFNISDSVESIVNKIKTAELKLDICDLYEYMLRLLTKLNLKTSIDIGHEQWYSCQNNEKMVLKIFISKLPNEPKLVLNSRNPHSLLKAKEILIETEYFYEKKSDLQSFSTFNMKENKRNRNGFNNKRFSNTQGNSPSPNTFFQNFPNNNHGNYTNQNYSNSNNLYNQNRNSHSPGYNNYNFQNNVQYRPNRSGNLSNRNSLDNHGNGNYGAASQQTINSSARMDVDNIQASNFQLSAEKLYPV